jgi:Z1 domain-containing protein
LIIDDEADFASVGYERRQGEVYVRRVQTLINAIRTGLANSAYLEVTATPYSLYLQPADIAEPATGQQFHRIRPAFTKLVPEHGGYVGGDFYFDRAQEPGHVASFIHVSVPDNELADMRQPVAVEQATLLTSANLTSLRRALVTFVVGGVMRRIDEMDSSRPERLYSFIVHLERLRDAHTDQQELARQLIEALRTANLETPPVSQQLQAAYDDLRRSRDAGQLSTKRLDELLPHIRAAFASVSTEIVNSDRQLEQLLDNAGQLRQESPLNIYIGGQSLDRGVTIANVIGFYYGRDPRVAQQDTTIQHCRMYGDRASGDLAVTRFYTSRGIYARMRRMHEFDKLLWQQLRLREEGLDQVYEPGDVVFLARDRTGEVRQCAPSKIVLTKAQWVNPSGELAPYPLSTASDRPDEPAALQLRDRLLSLGRPSQPFAMSVRDACDLLDDVFALIRVDDGWDWDFEAMKDALHHLASLHPDAEQRQRVMVLYTLDSNMAKWKVLDVDPQRAPYTPTTEDRVRKAAGRSPALALYYNNGTADGWSGSPFVWPALFVPLGIPATVFANNRRSGAGRRARRNRRARA